MYESIEIVQKLQNRDNETAAYVRRRFLPMIEYLVYRSNGQKEDAEDVFNEALFYIFKMVDADNFELKCKFKTFFYAVCDNLWKQRLEQKRVAGKYPHKKNPEPESPDFTEKYDSDLIRSLVWKAFSKLENTCKKILKMVNDEVPYKNIADEVGLSYNYVRIKKFKCKKQLVDLIVNDPKNMKLLNELIPYINKISL